MLCRNTPVYVITNSDATMPTGRATAFARRNPFGSAKSPGAAADATHSSSTVSEYVPTLM